MQETQEIWVQSLGQEDTPEKEMAAHSGILAWEIPWAEKPGRRSSDMTERLSVHAFAVLLSNLVEQDRGNLSLMQIHIYMCILCLDSSGMT